MSVRATPIKRLVSWWRQAHEEALGRNQGTSYFRSLNFSSQNEDWRTEARALGMSPSDTVLCVTGSGDRPLNLLAAGEPRRMVAIDCDSAQNHLLALKVEGIRKLSYDDYVSFVGLRPAEPEWRIEVLCRICGGMAPNARAFWLANQQLVGEGVIYTGRFERYFARIGRLSRLLRGRVIDELFSFTDLGEQRRFVEEVWDKWWWRLVFQVLCSTRASRVFYGDPAYFAHVQVPVGDYFYDRIKRYLTRELASGCFMLGLIFRGRLPDSDLPPYLTRSGVEAIRSRLGCLDVVTDDLLNHLGSVRSGVYSKYSLSDVPSYLSTEDFSRLLSLVLRSGRAGARVVVRQFLTRYALPSFIESRLVRIPELEKDLAVEDHALAYEFIVADLAPGKRGNLAGISTREYLPSDDGGARALDRRVSQGESFKLCFVRPTFHRRAQNFDRHRIVVAESEGTIVGTLAVAIKEGVVRGRRRRVAFFFDARVDPALQGRGIGTEMMLESMDWALGRADFAYLYATADNSTVASVAHKGGWSDAGGFTYLIYPTWRKERSVESGVRASSLNEVHDFMRDVGGPFEFYTDPREGGSLDGWVASWLKEGPDGMAACSVWDNSQILNEVVVAMPRTIALVGGLCNYKPLSRLRLPPIPRVGEPIRSWYVFDLHSTHPRFARSLMRFVAGRAAQQRIDYCYAVLQNSDPLLGEVRKDVNNAIAPLAPYRMFAYSTADLVEPMSRLYVDIRDL